MRTVHAPLSIAAVALALVLPRSVQEAPETVREPSSKVEFPVLWQADEESPVLELAGTAIRTKTIFSVKVYAYGLYVEPTIARARLAAWEGVALKPLSEDDEFYAALMADELPKCLRIVFARDVDADDVAGAFESSLRERVERAHEELELPDATEALAKFRAYFGTAEYEKKDEIRFAWFPEGKLRTWIRGEEQEVLESPGLCWALFDVYLGEDPIMDTGKRTVVDRIPALLAREEE